MHQFTVVVPAAGSGTRMAADRPKQYLNLNGKSIIEHTLQRLISHPQIKHIVVVLAAEDTYFNQLPVANEPWVTQVVGGETRAQSVQNGLKSLSDADWVLVHDAARPCITHKDLSNLIALHSSSVGGILATRVRDTMKRSDNHNTVTTTEPRENLWHALTPQFFPYQQLLSALTYCAEHQLDITD